MGIGDVGDGYHDSSLPAAPRSLWDDAGVNRLDWFLIALAVLLMWTGYRRGALRQLLSWGGLVLGLAGGAMLAPQVAPAVTNPVGRVSVALGCIVAGGIAGNIAGRLLGRLVRSGAEQAHVGKLDSGAGAAIALASLALITWFVAINLVNGPIPGVAREIEESKVVEGLDAVLPEPPELLARVRDFFNRFDFPQVFAGLPPAPAGPVRAPTQADAARAFDRGSTGTVRIVGSGCEQLQEGSGFVFAPNFVLTNAHVVAGTDLLQVQQQDGGTQTGTPVLFDPRLDVAVLRVAETPGTVLALRGTDVPRGTGGAVIGFPGGGDLTGSDAAVRRVLQAEGRDIYGRGDVTREVYELQTEVQPGNSGGPFVLTDGSVAGMVFAASTTDKDLGYAITSSELQDDLNRAVLQAEAVPTGSCIR